VIVYDTRNVVIHRPTNASQPLARKHGHVYIHWYSKLLFADGELLKLHHNFFHSTVNNLIDLLSTLKSRISQFTLVNHWTTSLRDATHVKPLVQSPTGSSVSMPDSVLFSDKLAIDLFCLKRKASLHVHDLHTHFSAAGFLQGQSVDDFWTTLLTIWACVYPGLPNVIKADKGSVVTSALWRDIVSISGVKLELSMIESQNSLTVGERYHDPLHRIYRRVRHEFSTITEHLALSLANKAINHTVGPEGLVPTLLVFGIIPRLSADEFLPNQHNRMLAMDSARREMDTIVSKLRKKRGLSSKTPPGAIRVYLVNSYTSKVSVRRS
jgi:hypothetical protein